MNCLFLNQVLGIYSWSFLSSPLKLVRNNPEKRPTSTPVWHVSPCILLSFCNQVVHNNGLSDYVPRMRIRHSNKAIFRYTRASQSGFPNLVLTLDIGAYNYSQAHLSTAL